MCTCIKVQAFRLYWKWDQIHNREQHMYIFPRFSFVLKIGKDRPLQRHSFMTEVTISFFHTSNFSYLIIHILNVFENPMVSSFRNLFILPGQAYCRFRFRYIVYTCKSYFMVHTSNNRNSPMPYCLVNLCETTCYSSTRTNLLKRGSYNNDSVSVNHN